MSVKEFEERTLKAKEMLERVCKDINFRRLYRHRLTQMGNYKHRGITEKIIGAAYKVHKTLGSGFLE
jgi:hypothetical protein